MELISKEVVKQIIDSRRTRDQMLEIVDSEVTVEECDDCISREAVLEILGNYGCTNREGLLFRDIKELPPVQPKTGHWIDSSNGWMCSECKCDNTFDTNYCPNCGAKMESEE